MSKKIISVLLSLTMLMSLLPLSIVFATNKTELVVGFSTPFEPFQENVNGELVGYDVDVMNYICSQLNLEPKYIDISDFTDLLPMLFSGEVDCVTAMGATEERMKKFDFTRPYYVGKFIDPEMPTDELARWSIAFPKGSSYTKQFNDIIFKAEKNGTLQKIASKYGLEYNEMDAVLKGDFSEFAGTYKYNSGNSFELLANGLTNLDISDTEMEYRVEDITKKTDGTYSWSINCYYYGECMDGIMCILYPKGVEVVSYDGSILPTDTSKVRFWSGNAEVSDVQYIAYKQDNATNGIKVVLNGEEIKFDQPPIMAEDRILVPIRKIAEAMGDTVLWNDEYQTAFIKHEDRGLIIKLLEDHIKIVKNEHWTQWEEKELDVMAFSLNGRTLVPVRAFCESLGADVSWNGDEYTAYITYDFNKETKEMSSETFKNINTVYYALNNDDVSFDAYSDDFNFFYNNRNMQKDAVKMGVSDIWAGVNDLLSGLSNSENVMKNSFEQMLTVVPNNDIVSINKELFDDLKDFADNSKYIFDKINGIDDEFLELHPNLKTLDTSIEAVGTAYDIMSFSTEQIAVFLSNYETNISYIEQLRSILQENNLLDDNLNTSLVVLQQEYSDKFFNVMLNTRDELEKFTITEGTNFATGGLFSVGVFTWEQLFKLSGITDDGQALKTFYGLYCINGLLDTAYNRTNDKILNGDYTPSDVEDLKILDDLQRALKIKTYQCIKIISQDSDTHSMCDEYIKQISKSSILWKRD